MPQQRRRAHERGRVVGREVVAVVVERGQIERVDQRARGIAGDDVDLAVSASAR